MKSIGKWWIAAGLLAGGGSAILYADSHGGISSTDPKIEEMQKSVDGDLRHVRRLQDVARRQNDIVKLTCVNDKLIELKAAANIFDEHRHAIDSRSAMSSLSEDASVAHRLRSEADACIGEPQLAGESTNGFEHGVFPDDPTLNISYTPIEPPVYASPFN